MRRLYIFILLILGVVGGQASSASNNRTIKASAPVKALEVELGGGIASPTNRLEFDKNKVGYNLLAEVRCNFRRRPFDIGLRVDGNTFNRQWASDQNQEYSFKFSSINMMAVFNLNINRKGAVSPFIGVGIGGALTSNEPLTLQAITNQPIKQTVKAAEFCVMPRIGFELFHHVRLTFFYKYLKDANSHFGLSAGVVFGGGRKY
ncbi:MAG: hypothetical protein IJX65_01280 [Alistipes sp.]|nr:hypothetical protein [Alistipes sp.]